MPGHCCVPKCTGKGGHRFPKKKKLRDRWIQAVKRGEHGWTPKEWTTVCRCHFHEADYQEETIEFRKYNDY